MVRDIELLAPAGNSEALHAAVQSGADAVYIGGTSFNARQSAKNFTIEDIKREADHCHLYGVDLHVTLNTLIKERELKKVIDYVEDLNDAGVDALIVQDLGVAKLIRKICPDMPLHASTQMTVTSLEGVRYLEDMGFTRVVLARELSCDEIKKITDNAKAEIEVFVHGALCMCYSGQCLMSSILGARSANRGRCAQPCRLNYTLTDNMGTDINAYALSPKDLAMVDELNRLRGIGVKSLKIEGRLKRAEYVSAVTGIYRKYLDTKETVSKDDLSELKNAFSRSGFTKGYFNNKLGKDMMSHKISGNVSENIFTDAAKERTRDGANIRKIPVYMYASLRDNEPLSITLTDDEGHIITVNGEMCAEKAINKPLDEERLREQLNKLGNTPFLSVKTEVSIDKGITIPIKEINNLRREACEKLTDERIKREKRKFFKADLSKNINKTYKKTELYAECYTLEQAKECLRCGIKKVFVPSDIDINDDRVIKKADDIYSDNKLPCNSLMISNPADIRRYKDRELYGDFRLNVYNSYTADLFNELCEMTLSPELNIHEIKEVINNTDALCSLIAYGKLPLMIMKNCPIKALGKCQDKKMRYSLRDRKNEEFQIICKNDCRAVLLNSKPVFMADKMEDLLALKPHSIRLIFTTEDKAAVGNIIGLYKDAMDNKKVRNIFLDNDFTRGHYYRGVE